MIMSASYCRQLVGEEKQEKQRELKSEPTAGHEKSKTEKLESINKWVQVELVFFCPLMFSSSLSVDHRDGDGRASPGDEQQTLVDAQYLS